MTQPIMFDVYAKHMFVGSMTVFPKSPFSVPGGRDSHMFMDTSGNLWTSDCPNGAITKVAKYKQLNLKRRG